MKFEAWEIVQALDNNDIQPDNSPYWDSPNGQDDLACLRAIESGEVTQEEVLEARRVAE